MAARCICAPAQRAGPSCTCASIPTTRAVIGTIWPNTSGALAQGLIAVNSILRDWIKGQIMAIETGLLSFEAVFLPFMLTHDGRTIADRADELKTKLLEGAP